jgi:GT2 family glycosyltransferase
MTAMPSPKVCVLILNRDRRDDTLACLRSLLPSPYPNLDVVLLDNASSDGTAAAVRAAYPDTVTVIETGGNLGYAGGNNVGIEWAQRQHADYVLLLNEDTIVDPAFLGRLVAAAEQRPGVGFLGPLVYHHNEPQVIQSAGGIITPGWHTAHRGQNQPDTGQYTTPMEADWVSGCAIFMRMRVVDQIGMLDPAFFIYSEEVDWCVRARRAGFAGLVVPAARIWHKGVRRDYTPSPRVTYLSARNHLRLLRKHHAGTGTLLRAMAGNVRTLASWTVKPRWRSQRQHRDALARAMVDFCRGSFGPPPF